MITVSTHDGDPPFSHAKTVDIITLRKIGNIWYTLRCHNTTDLLVALWLLSTYMVINSPLDLKVLGLKFMRFEGFSPLD